jgi:hypothetical protein
MPFLPYPPPPRDPIRSAELIEPLDIGKSRSFAPDAEWMVIAD